MFSTRKCFSQKHFPFLTCNERKDKLMNFKVLYLKQSTQHDQLSWQITVTWYFLVPFSRVYNNAPTTNTLVAGGMLLFVYIISKNHSIYILLPVMHESNLVWDWRPIFLDLVKINDKSLLLVSLDVLQNFSTFEYMILNFKTWAVIG